MAKFFSSALYLVSFFLLVILANSPHLIELANANADVQGAANATNLMVDELELMSRDIQSKIKILKNDDLYAGPAYRIFKISLDAIRIVFKDELDQKADNILSATKQIACIFVAETHYGNLTGAAAKDSCDVSNIAQIRPPAYQALFEKCSKDEAAKNFYSSMFGPDMNCDNLHPYELPPCTDATFPEVSAFYKSNDNKTPTQEDLNIDEEMSPAKRFSELQNQMDQKKEAKGKPKLASNRKEDSALKCVNQSRLNYLDTKYLPIMPDICNNTNNRQAIQLPAIEEHSIFAGILYLKIRGFNTTKSDLGFPSFGATQYNGADGAEQTKYSQKVNRCLAILNNPENNQIVKNAFDKVLEAEQGEK